MRRVFFWVLLPITLLSIVVLAFLFTRENNDSLMTQIETLLHQNKLWIGDSFAKVCPPGYDLDQSKLDQRSLQPPLIDGYSCSTKDDRNLFKDITIMKFGGSGISHITLSEPKSNLLNCDDNTASNFSKIKNLKPETGSSPSALSFSFDLPTATIGVACTKRVLIVSIFSRAQTIKVDSELCREYFKEDGRSFLLKEGRYSSLRDTLEEYVVTLQTLKNHAQNPPQAQVDQTLEILYKDFEASFNLIKTQSETLSQGERNSIDLVLDKNKFLETLRETFANMRKW